MAKKTMEQEDDIWAKLKSIRWLNSFTEAVKSWNVSAYTEQLNCLKS